MNTQLMIAGYCPVGNYSFEIIYKKYHTFSCTMLKNDGRGIVC